jgi:hypothetical protein
MRNRRREKQRAEQRSKVHLVRYHIFIGEIVAIIDNRLPRRFGHCASRAPTTRHQGLAPGAKTLLDERRQPNRVRSGASRPAPQFSVFTKEKSCVRDRPSVARRFDHCMTNNCGYQLPITTNYQLETDSMSEQVKWDLDSGHLQ